MTTTRPTPLYFEDVAISQEVPPLSKTPTRVGVFLYGVAYWTAHRIHYDKDWARSEGYDDVLVTAGLMTPYITQMLCRWAGHPFCVRRLDAQNRAFVYPDTRLTARGIVRKLTPEEGHGLAECDVWLERDDGVRPVVGTAVVRLPLREES